MPAELIKLVLSASNTVSGDVNVSTVTDVAPIASRYAANVTALMILGGNTTIPATSFRDDNGNSLAAGGLPVPNTETVVNVYVNGVLQQGGLSTLSANNLLIRASILLGAPVVLEYLNFSNVTSASTATNTLAVDTVIDT
ncbi:MULTISPECIES: DUF4183 domain-containing protein [Bacillaceae]|uniref:DUF4183 domain-containing protein n=1 Tax=Metabacillus sediminis TaxID=3117746 RepID=A0ABZ2NLF9_9BACI|nr:DUF4183 domain-containing protein [Bacillus sp. SJS]KZZ83667.1 hypothetical protein AS29_015290 [Bacillus sp. SJS]